MVSKNKFYELLISFTFDSRTRSQILTCSSLSLTLRSLSGCHVDLFSSSNKHPRFVVCLQQHHQSSESKLNAKRARPFWFEFKMSCMLNSKNNGRKQEQIQLTRSRLIGRCKSCHSPFVRNFSRLPGQNNKQAHLTNDRCMPHQSPLTT